MLLNCFNKAREVLKGLNYPTLDAITPIDKALKPDLSYNSEFLYVRN